VEFDFGTLPPPDRYKLLIGLVVPRPIALVTTRGGDGAVNAAPFSFFNVFSHDPAVVALGIERRPGTSVPKDTVLNIREGGEFVVNLVDLPIAEAMNVCAVDFPQGIDELAAAGLTAVAAQKVAAPRIAEAPAALECRLMQEIRLGEGGKRSLVLGEILHVHVRDGLVNERFHVDNEAFLGRLAGAGYVRLTDRFEMKRLNVAEWEARSAAD
jgi:flavin reductase (DIM6/NTAB) family NADH-FMN oxidoreductase RutF